MADPSAIRPFKRNLNIDPFKLIMDGTNTPIPTQIGRDMLRAQGVTSYKMQNDNPFWCWYRGWNGNGGMPAIKEFGHYIGPGQTDINTSQTPDWIAAIPVARPGFPLYDGNGNWLFSAWESRLIYTLGSGA